MEESKELIRNRANNILETVEMMGSRETKWEDSYVEIIRSLVQDINTITE